VNPKNFFVELKRRHVYKIAVIYAVVAWLLIQVATQVFPFFEIPNWGVRLIVLFIVIGFPVALIIAWAFELTPEGLKRTEAADELPKKSAPNRVWIYVVVIAGAISIGLFFLGRFTAPNKQSGPAEVTTKSIAAGARIDHIMIGAANLDRAIDDFEKATGVRPVYGGKHPSGTHNALVSLGEGTYLELIAVQPGVKPPPSLATLPNLQRLTPIGWAVSVADAKAFGQQLTSAGFPVTDLKPGSRITPSGATLRWQTFRLQSEFPGAPFFILWAPGTPHPSSTSPVGCKLERLTVAGPKAESISRLRSVLAIPIEVANSASEQLTVSLLCPKGRVVFE
jgi:catechol 2,3-dioxygenase-like lactoylglutathione lyase family enzyme